MSLFLGSVSTGLLFLRTVQALEHIGEATFAKALWFA
jgi:hypothetical protein